MKEEAAVLQLLDRKQINRETDMEWLTSEEAFAMGQALGCPTSTKLRDRLEKILGSPLAVQADKPVMEELNPGLLSLTMDKDPLLRDWAIAQSDMVRDRAEDTAVVGLSRYNWVIRKVVDELSSPGAQTKGKLVAWRTAAYALQYIPQADRSLIPLVVTQLGDQEPYFQHVLRCYQLLLDHLKGDLWQQDACKEPEFSNVLLSNILDNREFITLLEQHTDQQKDPTSLSQPMQALLSHTRSLAVKGKEEAFTHTVKTVANFLMEKMQQGHYAFPIRTTAMASGIKIINSIFHESTRSGREAWLTAGISAATMYAGTLSSVALNGRLPNSDERININSTLSSAARQLIQHIVTNDAKTLRSAFFGLAAMTQRHQKAWRSRCREKDGELLNPDAPSGKEILQSATSERFPNPSVCKALWEACYDAMSTSAGKSAFETVLPALAILASFVEPNPASFLSMSGAENYSDFHTYRLTLRKSILDISSALNDVRAGFPTALEDCSAALSEDNIHMLCASAAEQLVILNLSPDEPTHFAAQNLARAASSEVTVRADCFRFLVSVNPEGSLSGISKSLKDFENTSETLPEANALAKWTVRSLADALDVLCSMRDGLLRHGTTLSLLGARASRKAVADQLPNLWRFMCQSLAVIFLRTPKWATLSDRSDMVAWFRDVNIFAIEVVEQMKTFEDALCAAEDSADGFGEATKQRRLEFRTALAADIAVPLEKAMTWLRLNDTEIMYETRKFLLRALDCFEKGIKLPEARRARMLEYINSQLRIANPEKRNTLLSLSELADLKYKIDPSLKPVELSDSSEDEESFDEVVVQQSTSRAGFTSVDPVKAALQPTITQKTARLHQQKLDFSKAIPPRPKPLETVNKFSAPSMQKSLSNEQHASKLAQLRSEFRSGNQAAASSTKRRPPAPPTHGPAWEVPVKGPAASTNVKVAASAFGGQKVTSATEDGTTDESSESEDDTEAKGLAALKMKSPLKRLKAAARPTVRRTKLLEEDPRLKQTMREQEEIERRRRLRAPADFTFLHQSILMWRYDDRGEVPPNHGTPRNVPKSFASGEEYMSIFGPLLLTECWAGLQSAKEEYNESRTVTLELSSRSNVDNFIDLNMVYVEKGPNKVEFSDADLVFIREAQAMNGAPRIAIAKVENYRRNYLGNQVVVRLCLQNDKQGLNSALVPRSQWKMGSLLSLATLHRECTALMCAPYLDLRQQVLKAEVPPLRVVDPAQRAALMELYQLNEPQANAIIGSLRTRGFSLIQGPPGTGKTKTICGLVGKFLADRAQKPTNVSVNVRAVGAVGPKAKILVCAPSNAAVDEVTKRLKFGVKSADGQVFVPKIVRIGRDDSMNVEVKDVSLDFLLDKALASGAGAGDDVGALQEEIRQLQTQRQQMQASLDAAKKGNDQPNINSLTAELRLLMSKRTSAMSKLDQIKDQQKSDARQRDAERRQLRHQIIMDADVICCTLAGAGHDSLSSLGIDFETVVIDEAAQAVELSSLIPLRYGCQTCIMVGDPNQLPPTVLSKAAERLGYSRSLFVRLFNPNSVYLLS